MARTKATLISQLAAKSAAAATQADRSLSHAENLEAEAAISRAEAAAAKKDAGVIAEALAVLNKGGVEV